MDRTGARISPFSVKEYLCSNFVDARFRQNLMDIHAHGAVAEVCMAYITYVGGKTNTRGWVKQYNPQLFYNGIEKRGTKTINAFPFLNYAALHWMDHADQALALGNFESQMCNFTFDPKKSHEFAQWFSTANFDSMIRLSPALVDAARHGFIHIVKFLAQKGANVNAKDTSGETALVAASKKGHEPTVRVLLEHGADVNVQKDLALVHAVCDGSPSMVDLLLKHGAEVKVQVSSVLYTASILGHQPVVEILLKHGVDANTQRYNSTPRQHLLLASVDDVKMEVKEILDWADAVNATSSSLTLLRDLFSEGQPLAETRQGDSAGIDTHGSELSVALQATSCTDNQ